MWVLVASDRALDTPCLWRVFQISCWNRLMVRASATNSWSRERRAQAIQPPRSCSPWRAFGGEDRAELFLEQVGAVEGGVRGPDRGQALSLVRGEVLRVLHDSPAGVAVPVAGVFQRPATDLVQLLGAPHHDMERVQANRGLRCLFPDDRMDPFRAVGRDMRQQRGSGVSAVTGDADVWVGVRR